MPERTIIFANGDLGDPQRLQAMLNPDDWLVAADGGLRHLTNLGQVPDLIIQIGLEEIDDEEYEETLKEILQRKNREISEKDPFKRKQKLVAFAAQKGYDYGLIKHVLGKM